MFPQEPFATRINSLPQNAHAALNGFPLMGRNGKHCYHKGRKAAKQWDESPNLDVVLLGVLSIPKPQLPFGSFVASVLSQKNVD